MTILFGIHLSDCFCAPASGYRYRETGALTNVGSNGYVWSSSPYAAGNVSAGSMDFSVSFVRPLNYYARAYAFSVRCVQHLQLLFQKIPYRKILTRRRSR